MRAIAISGVLVALTGALSGCCSYNSYGSAPQALRPFPNNHLVAWDGRIRAERVRQRAYPIHQTVNATGAIEASPDAELARLTKYSPEWWAIRDALDRKDEARLSQVMSICRGCVAPTYADSTVEQTGSVDAKP
jgi:hypothetical protein